MRMQRLEDQLKLQCEMKLFLLSIFDGEDFLEGPKNVKGSQYCTVGVEGCRHSKKDKKKYLHATTQGRL